MQEMKWWGAAALAALLCGTGCAPGDVDTPVAEELGDGTAVREALTGELRFSPVADAYLEAAYPAVNHGTASRLEADGSPRMESLLRFRVSGTSGSRITRARLRLYAIDGSSDGPAVHATAGGWSESSVTWSTRPDPSTPAVADLARVTSATFVELDVTSLVRGDGDVNLMLVPTASDGVTFASREASTTSQRPVLIVDLQDAQPSCTLPAIAFDRFESVTWHDTVVWADDPARSGWGQPELLTDTSPRTESYLRAGFHWPEQVRLRSAKLRLWVTNSSSNGPRLYFTENTWEHGSMNWNTRPALQGGPLADAGAVTAGTWFEYDLTALRPRGQFSFGLIPDSSDGADFVSSHGPLDQRVHSRVDYEWDYCARQGPGGAPVATRTLGGPGHEPISASAAAPGGGTVLVASDVNGADYGGGALTGALALVKLNADGTHAWSRVYGSESDHVNGLSVAVTSLGNILLAGTYSGPVDLGTGPLPSSHGMFVAKYAPDGRAVWVRTFHGSYPGRDMTYPINPFSVATDANGSVIVTGTYLGEVNFGGATLPAWPGSVDWDESPFFNMFLVKLTWEGQHVFSRAFPRDSGDSEGHDVATDADGNVVVSGRLGANSDLGAGRLNNPTGQPFVARYSPQGALQWARRWDVYGQVDSVAVDPDSGQVGLGVTLETGTFRWAGGSLTGIPGEPQSLVGVLGTDGQDVWFRPLPAAHSPRVEAQAGGLVLTGVHTGALDLGGGPLPTALFSAAHVARYTLATGELRWSRTLPVGNPVQIHAHADGRTSAVLPFYGTTFYDARSFESRGGLEALFFNVGP